MTSSICAYESSLFWTHSGTFLLVECAQTLAPWCIIRKKSSSGTMNIVSMKKPFASKEKTSAVWYSHQCTPASHHSWCTSTSNKIASLVLCKSTHTHFHLFTPSRPPPPEKTPKAMVDKGKTTRGEQPPIKEANHPRVISFSHSFLLILIAISWFIFLWFQPRPTAGGHLRYWRNP
jgi:hypothetical protein